MASICLILLLVSTFLISFSQQQALFTETQQKELEENEIERKISEKLGPLVNEYATKAFNAAIEELRQKFTAEIKLLTDEIAILSNRSTQVKEAFNDITSNSAKGRLGCPETHDGRFLLHGTYCYMFRNEKLTWVQAKEWCAAKNAHLARITSTEINLYLKKECGLRSKQFWLGGHDVTQEGKWIWEDDEPIDSDVMDWAPGEPNNYGGGQDCLGIGHGRRLQWDDKSCGSKLEFVCQTAAVRN